MLKLRRVTKVKVLFLVLVFVFNFTAYSNVFEFSAAILEKGLFTKTIIPFALVGCEVIITNLHYTLVGYFITSYPTRAHGIIILLCIPLEIISYYVYPYYISQVR